MCPSYTNNTAQDSQMTLQLILTRCCTGHLCTGYECIIVWEKWLICLLQVETPCHEKRKPAKNQLQNREDPDLFWDGRSQSGKLSGDSFWKSRMPRPLTWRRKNCLFIQVLFSLWNVTFTMTPLCKMGYASELQLLRCVQLFCTKKTFEDEGVDTRVWFVWGE